MARAVEEITIEGTSIVKAKVSGNSRYRVVLDFRSFTRSSCSCPYGFNCKHMAAVLFQLAKQEGFDPQKLRSGMPSPKQAVAKLTQSELLPQGPKSTDTCDKWWTYFDHHYRNTKVYHAFALEEACMRVWKELNKLADDWEPTIRGLYDIQVSFYVIRLCDELARMNADKYDFYYNGHYFFKRVLNRTYDQMITALQDIDKVRAQVQYKDHLKAIAGYTAEVCEKGSMKYMLSWFDYYRLLWTRLLDETSLIELERARLRNLASDSLKSREAYHSAVLGLIFWDVQNEEDENAWERAMLHVRGRTRLLVCLYGRIRSRMSVGSLIEVAAVDGF